MTTVLFPDLYPEILKFLGKKDLMIWSLVNSDSRRLAQSILFREIRFNLGHPDYWCFFRTRRGRELCSEAQSLHLFWKPKDWSLPDNQSIDGLTDFMRGFVNLRTLECSMIKPNLGRPRLPFWPSIIATVCPYIDTLTLYAMEVPLWDILTHSPLLKRLKLCFVITSEPSTPIPNHTLPELIELDLGDLCSGIGTTNQLWRLFTRISSFQSLKVDTNHSDWVISLDFIRPSKSNLRTISFGYQFYKWVVPKPPRYCRHRLIQEPHSTRGQLNLNGFSQLERLSFTIWYLPNNEQWVVWLTWLALLLHRPLPTSLNDLEIHLNPAGQHLSKDFLKNWTPVKDFDALACNSRVGILFIIHISRFEEPEKSKFRGSERNEGVRESYEDAVMLIEKTMPLWCSRGKVKIIRVNEDQ